MRRAHVCLGLSSTKLRLCIAHSPKIPELGRPVADPGRHYGSSFTRRPWQQTQQNSLHRAAGRQTGKTSQGRSLLAATRRRAIGSPSPRAPLADEALHGLKPRALSCSIRAVHTPLQQRCRWSRHTPASQCYLRSFLPHPPSSQSLELCDIWHVAPYWLPAALQRATPWPAVIRNQAGLRNLLAIVCLSMGPASTSFWRRPTKTPASWPRERERQEEARRDHKKRELLAGPGYASQNSLLHVVQIEGECVDALPLPKTTCVS